MDTHSAYERLGERFERATDVFHARGYLNWDQQVAMPPGGASARAEQLSTLSVVRRNLLASRETRRLLDAIDPDALDARQAAVVREIERAHDRAAAVPESLVDELSRAEADAHEQWKRAKADDDFDSFAPALERLVELRRERAAHVDPDARPYEVMLREHEPYLSLDTVEDVLATVRDTVRDLVDRIRAVDREIPTAFEGEFDADVQLDCCEALLDWLGFDRSRGRLDVAEHPFTMGTPYDVRVTTRVDESDPSTAIRLLLHEYGHATYQLGLPQSEYGTPLGEARYNCVHGSQSQFWEHHVGGSEAFWARMLPRLRDAFAGFDATDPASVHAAVNRVVPDNQIRVDADPLTYHLHVAIRTEVERKLVAGDVEVSEVPQLWNDLAEEYLGSRPASDAEGCLQDVHWTRGFASFQSYTLGHVLAAQFRAAIESSLGSVDEMVRRSAFDELRGWHERNVHAHGQRYATQDLVREATGEGVTPEYFCKYVTAKYGETYDI